MADQPSSTAAKKSKKKGGGIVNLFRDLIKRPKSANDSASQSNSARVSDSSTFGTHDPVPAGSAEPTNSTWVFLSSASGTRDPISGNNAGNAEPTALSKYIDSILVLSMKTWPLQILPPSSSQHWQRVKVSCNTLRLCV